MKRNLLLLAFIALTLTALGQGVSKNAVIDETEVPVAVRQAFEQDFGAIPEGGQWKVYYRLEELGTRLVAQPRWYSFTKKENGTRIEARFSPKGELMFSKGLTLKASAETP